jgi:GDP-mannose 6-dehydrogenase
LSSKSVGLGSGVVGAALPDAREKPAISVVGLGYVGAVSIACLSHLGFRMVGVDVSLDKVRAIKDGIAPIVEARLGELLADGVGRGLVDATRNLYAAIQDTDVTFLSVGTPTAPEGGCDLSHVRAASRAIGHALERKAGYHVVVLRCSVPPGTSLGMVAAEIEAVSGKRLGPGFGICFNPELLREGSAVADFFAPAKTVIGASDERARAMMTRIWGAIAPEILYTSIEAAEMVKYVDNVWHATKVVFANEVGRLCKALAIDSHQVMELFLKDTKLNLSPYYLKPGFAFGGSCLPKEVRAVAHIARERGVALPLVESLIPSNEMHVAHARALLEPHRGKRIGVLGLSFKPGTDDLRESPTLDLMAALHAEGWQLAAYDANLAASPSLLDQIEAARGVRPSIGPLLDALPALLAADARTLVAASDVIVVSHADEAYSRALAGRRNEAHVLELTRPSGSGWRGEGDEGIAW